MANPVLTTTSTFGLEIGGVMIAQFRKCSGIESETEATEYKAATKEGKMIITYVPGAEKWPPFTLSKPQSGTKELWDWRKQVLDGNVDSARRDGSIVLMDSTKKEIARWNFVRGWPSKWSGGEFDASSNDVAMEEITIHHEGIHWA